MGRPIRIAYVLAGSQLTISDDVVLECCKGLADVANSISHQVKVATEPVKDIQCHPLKPGDWVHIRKHTRKSGLQPRWKGSHQVILVMKTAVKCAGILQWIRTAHTKKVKQVGEEDVVFHTTASQK